MIRRKPNRMPSGNVVQIVIIKVGLVAVPAPSK